MKISYNLVMIYLDNAATSFPKAPRLAEVTYNYLKTNARNISRTTSKKALEAEDDIFTLRENIAKLLGKKESDTVFLNSGATESINTVLRGFLKKGDHVIKSPVEHNAVMRTLTDIDAEYSFPSANKEGRIKLEEINKIKRENTKAIVFSATSNVTGAVVDIKKLSEIANDLSLPLIIDAAEALPYLDVDFDENNISAICFSGHKGLLGPQGSGGFALRKDFAKALRPLITGGSGSFSNEIKQPEIFPDKFESGTRNIPALIGMAESVEYVLENLDCIRKAVKDNTSYFLSRLLSLDNITVHGPKDEERSSIISISAKSMDNAELAEILVEKYEIETRVGLHCAPFAHKAIDTFPYGTIRFSVGCFTKKDELDFTIDALKKEAR